MVGKRRGDRGGEVEGEVAEKEQQEEEEEPAVKKSKAVDEAKVAVEEVKVVKVTIEHCTS